MLNILSLSILLFMKIKLKEIEITNVLSFGQTVSGLKFRGSAKGRYLLQLPSCLSQNPYRCPAC